MHWQGRKLFAFFSSLSYEFIDVPTLIYIYIYTVDSTEAKHHINTIYFSDSQDFSVLFCINIQHKDNLI